MTIIKKTKNNGILKIKEIPYKLSKKILVENHYSKTWNSNFGRINFGIFKDEDLMGVSAFGNMMNTKSYNKIIKGDIDEIIELNRLWIDDRLVKNAESVFISSCIKSIKKNYPRIKFIQSFADGRLGCGTIYKASNFKYYGYHTSMFIEDIETKEIFHHTAINNTKKYNQYLKTGRKYIDNKLSFFNVKTYRYIYSINNKYDDVLLKEKKYPLYEKGIKLIKYQNNDSMNIRLYLMFKHIKDNEYSEKFYNHLRQTMTVKEIDVLCENQINENKSLKEFLSLDKIIFNKSSSDIKMELKKNSDIMKLFF